MLTKALLNTSYGLLRGYCISKGFNTSLVIKIASVPICAIYRVESTERILSGLDIGANWVAVGNQYNLATYIHIF